MINTSIRGIENLLEPPAAPKISSKAPNAGATTRLAKKKEEEAIKVKENLIVALKNHRIGANISERARNFNVPLKIIERALKRYESGGHIIPSDGNQPIFSEEEIEKMK